MRAIAIDDDTNMLELLTNTLNRLALDVELVGTATNFDDGVALIKSVEPDLLFLDIELGNGKTAFDVLLEIEHNRYGLVFISGKQNYGDLVVRFSALAYIYKPMRPALLAEAVALAQLRMTEKNYQEEMREMLETAREKKLPTRMMLSNSVGRHVVTLSEIIYVRGQKESITVFREKGRPVVKGATLKSFAEDLRPYPEFKRVNKNYLVNLYHLDAEVKGPTLIMRDGMEIGISHAVAKEVREQLEQL